MAYYNMTIQTAIRSTIQPTSDTYHWLSEHGDTTQIVVWPILYTNADFSQDSSIILLDDATSALDAVSEKPVPTKSISWLRTRLFS